MHRFAAKNVGATYVRRGGYNWGPPELGHSGPARLAGIDISVQARILDLLADLQERLGIAYLFISHDLGVIHHMCDPVLVMKDGAIVESGDVEDVFYHPRDDYTRALLDAIPRLKGASHA